MYLKISCIVPIVQDLLRLELDGFVCKIYLQESDDYVSLCVFSKIYVSKRNIEYALINT